MNVRELKTKAKALGIKGFSRMTKAELSHAIARLETTSPSQGGPATRASAPEQPNLTRPDLESMSVKELRAHAKARGIRGFSTMRKGQLVDILLQPPVDAQSPKKKRISSSRRKKKAIDKGPKAPKIQHQYHSLVDGLGAVYFYLLLLAGGLAIFGVTEGAIGTALLSTIFLVPILIWQSRYCDKIDATVEAMRGGARATGWVVGPREHNAFLRKRLRQRLLMWALMALLVMGGLLYEAWEGDDFSLGLFAFAIGVGAGIYAVGFGVCTRYRKAMWGTPCEVMIGPKGIYRTGRWLGIAGLGVRLKNVTLLEGRPLMLSMDVQQSLGYMSATVEIKVPIPVHLAEHAPEIVKKLKRPNSTLGSLLDVIEFSIDNFVE